MFEQADWTTDAFNDTHGPLKHCVNLVELGLIAGAHVDFHPRFKCDGVNRCAATNSSVVSTRVRVETEALITLSPVKGD